ncbi:WD repeat-containing protein 33 [Saguinus oedipus]|uniref:WD repeat-containing protein 33 n=1 Tax=Saguinus oedipus TaxID=9490 RepID=A0ABQ9VIK0_SAGOE|nr:WD repeat-containing protein 33 [Saguinus oedipus]
MPRFQHQAPRQLFYKRPDFAQQQAMQQLTFDGKRMRKAVNRKTIDYNPSVIKYLENRIWQRDQRDMRAIQPDAGYYNDLVPPIGMLNNPMNAVTTKFVRTSTNKVKCPVFVVREYDSKEKKAHDSPVRAMTWSHNDMWMLTADHGGYVKYWQSNMNNVKMFQAHKEAIREARKQLQNSHKVEKGLSEDLVGLVMPRLPKEMFEAEADDNFGSSIRVRFKRLREYCRNIIHLVSPLKAASCDFLDATKVPSFSDT